MASEEGVGDKPSGQLVWIDKGDACCLTAVSLIQSFQIASESLSVVAPVSIAYVMEAEVPHMQCLWFQVRTHRSFGADLQSPTYYCKSPSPRGPGLGPG